MRAERKEAIRIRLMKNGVSQRFALKILLEEYPGYSWSLGNSSCTRYCKKFRTYSVTDEGFRIIPIGVKCCNIPGKICCADAKFVNPFIPSAEPITKPSLFEPKLAGDFEEDSGHRRRKFLRPVFIPRNGELEELSVLLEKFAETVNPDGATEPAAQMELLIEALAKCQAIVNWGKKRKRTIKWR